MSVNLRADNRSIIKDGKFSYLINNYTSLVPTVSLTNTEGFFTNSHILLGNIGSENTELLQIKSVDTVTGAITFANFTQTAIGSGISTVTIGAAGTGYLLGQILTVTQAGAVGGSVRVATIGVAGKITSVTVDQPGYGYSLANGLATVGGINNDATINITALTPATTATSILFNNAQSFVAGQPVEVFSAAGVSRGTGTVATSSNPSSTTMTLSGAGIVGTKATDSVVVGNITRFAHAESTKVTVVQYDQIRFFRTDTPVVPNLVQTITVEENQDKSITQKTTSTIGTTNTTTYTQPDDPSSVTTIDYTPPIVFAGATALTTPLTIQVNDFYTTFYDPINSTGYGWFSFYNSTTATYSPVSNPIPYSGFPQNTVKKTFEAFDSSINTKELKLITQSDRFNWLNEGISYMTNELNLGNWEYTASEEMILNIKAGVAKYLLPQDFSDLLFITDNRNNKMASYSATFQRAPLVSDVKYAIRGKFLVFYPAHQVDTTVTLAYLKNSAVLSKLDDVVDLPNNAYYAIKDFMRFRAYQKLQNTSESSNAFIFFKSQIDSMKIHALKRDDGLDSWSIDWSANV